MSVSESENGMERAELLQRVELMEQMIAEGRQATGRFGWIFVLWGVGYFVAIGWEQVVRRHWHPASSPAWPEWVLLTVGVGIIAVIANKIKQRQRRLYGGNKNVRSRSFTSVWVAMGCSLTLYNVGVLLSHHQLMPTFVATTLIIVGMANATSAMILRWKAQGLLAALCWAGGFAMFFVAPKYGGICYAAVYAGMAVFGLYAMMQEHRRDHVGKSPAQQNV